jgi:sugar/nucleoside kinase (ribokinase family)
MVEKKPIVCLGILVADLVGRPLRAVPDPGRLVLVDEMGLYTGGCAVNAATALKRLGLPVEVIGKVGSDALGDFMLNAMVERGIGTRGVRRDPEIGTSATMVMVDTDGERRFVHFIGANAMLGFDDIDLELVSEASILHVAGSLVLPGIDGEPTAKLLKHARENGVTTFLDTVWDDSGSWMTLMEPSLSYIDYFLPSLAEARRLVNLDEPQEVADRLLEYGINTVGLKMGADGCLVKSRERETIRLPSFQVKVVDATGGGDAFAAGFIAGVWQGLPLEETCRLANAVGALCVTGSGASGGVTDLEGTFEFMENTPMNPLRS